MFHSDYQRYYDYEQMTAVLGSPMEGYLRWLIRPFDAG